LTHVYLRPSAGFVQPEHWEDLQDYLPCTLARQNLTRTFNCTPFYAASLPYQQWEYDQQARDEADDLLGDADHPFLKRQQQIRHEEEVHGIKVTALESGCNPPQSLTRTENLDEEPNQAVCDFTSFDHPVERKHDPATP
jgi:hypothetical protein